MRIKHVRLSIWTIHSLERKKEKSTGQYEACSACQFASFIFIVYKKRKEHRPILSYLVSQLVGFIFTIQIKEKSVGQSEHVCHANLQVSQFRENIT
jgi:hypothetical protein